jgi:hypothetical protein
MSLIDRYLNILKINAFESDIDIKLSACLIKNKKLICSPCCNTERNTYRGINYGSIHAEANVLLKFFGKNLSFDRVKKRWCLLYSITKMCETT